MGATRPGSQRGEGSRRRVASQACINLSGTTPVRAVADIRCQQLFQRGQVTLLSAGHERLDQLPVLALADRSAFPACQALARSADVLAHARLRLLDDLRDSLVRVVERVPQHVGGPFARRELLECQPQSELKGLGAFRG